MTIRRALGIVAALLAWWTTPSRADADGVSTAATQAPSSQRTPALAAYFTVLQSKHLAPQTAEVEELRATLAHAEALALDAHPEEAALLLYEVIESPRFADYSELEEFDAALFTLGSALHALGAERSARVYLRRVIDKGPANPYFAPALRRYSDVALTQRDLAATLKELQGLSFPLPADARDEVAYLRGRERFDALDDTAAASSLAEVSLHSRFYANAQYLLGAAASRQRRFGAAEAHFCRVAAPRDESRSAFRVDQRYFQVKDLARLGLGRVAHEQGRSDDAFYYYFQVPEDSARLPEAMFEAAYAAYEGGDHQGSLDLLDQLEARFPDSEFSDEASVLRGYAALSGCDFERARTLFTRFISHFAPLALEIERIVQNPSRREALYMEMARVERAPERAPEARKTLLALLRVDPEFLALHERLRQLDAEAARAARVPELFDLVAARLAGGDRPRPSTSAAGESAAAFANLKEEVRDGRQALRALSGQLDTMRGLGAQPAALASVERQLGGLAGRLRAVEDRIEAARLDQRTEEATLPGSIEPLLGHDIDAARQFESRVSRLRPRLVKAANATALAELLALRARIAGFLRRARIGRIDAIMGSKRRIELQIESLAAGRFPAELRDPLRVQGFLADDEEYWPFEGEDWPDEFKEHYDADSGAPNAPAGAR